MAHGHRRAPVEAPGRHHARRADPGHRLGSPCRRAGPGFPIVFPVLGPVSYSDGWGAPRDGGRRRHVGTDLMGVRGQPLRAPFDGVVTRRRVTAEGIAGLMVTVTRPDGIRANLIHLNDDNPGTADGSAPAAWRIPDAVQVGTPVRAGQIIGFMGDTGNAVGVPHLHFEMRYPDGTPFNPYPYLVEAQQREHCVEAFGPWSNVDISSVVRRPSRSRAEATHAGSSRPPAR